MKLSSFGVLLGCLISSWTVSARLSSSTNSNDESSSLPQVDALESSNDEPSIQDYIVVDMASSNETTTTTTAIREDRDLWGNSGRDPHRRPHRPPEYEYDPNDPCPIHYYNNGNGWKEDKYKNCHGNGHGGGGHHGGGGGGHHGGGGGGFSGDGPYKFGGLKAEALWNNGRFRCDNVIPRFWNKVQDEVFDDCARRWERYGAWSESYKDCKDGAADFVLKKLGRCADSKDCAQIGQGASASVAGTFCELRNTYREVDWLPPRCKNHALSVCKKDVIYTVQDFMDDGVCGRKTNAFRFRDELHRKCFYEIQRMEDQASLGDY